MALLHCWDRIIFWPTDADGKATEQVLFLSYPEDGTNRIACGCRTKDVNPEAVEEKP